MILVVDLTQGVKAMFLPHLLKYLEVNNVDHKVVKKPDDLPKSGVSGVIISGSPLRLSRRLNASQYSIALLCILRYEVPVLGICFGCQLINVINGGTVKPFGRLVCEKHLVNGCPVQFCFNDYMDTLGIGVQAKHWVTIDGKKIPCHIQKGRFTGYLFHPEANFDKCEYLEKYLRTVKKYHI